MGYMKKGKEKNKAFLGYSGFSLVELMIVVAIIGVLASIAIPNFRDFQRRSRQSEAKASLTNIHTAQHGFHAEWEAFAGSLLAIGAHFAGEQWYVVGFQKAKQKFCGGDSTASKPTRGTAIGCGAAPNRKYKGKNAGTDDTSTLVCGASTGLPDCTKGFDSAEITDGHLSGPTVVVTTDGKALTDVNVNDFQAAAIADLKGTGAEGDFDVWIIDEDKNLENEESSLE